MKNLQRLRSKSSIPLVVASTLLGQALAGPLLATRVYADTPAATDGDSLALPASQQVPQKPLAQSAVDIAQAGTQQWEALQKKGDNAFTACEYGNAERAYNSALAVAFGFPKGDLRLAKTAGALGRLLTVRGRFAEAEPYLEIELRTKELSSGIKDEELIQPTGSLVRFYLNYGTASKADALSERILRYINGTLADVSTQGQGKVKLQAGGALQGWAGEAAPEARDPLIEWAITCDDIGNLYSAHEQYDMAERLFKAALDVKSTVLGKQHLSLANSYDNLGTLCLARHQYENAESYFKDALQITEHIQGAGGPQVYSRLDKLAKCLMQEEKFAEAEALYQRSLTFWPDEPANYGSIARAKYALGSLYCQEKKYAEAAPLLESALQLAEQNQGPDSVGIVPYLQKYAYVLYYLDRRAEVEPLKARALSIQPASNSL
ncbi:MAG: tetratricopeptide repeat protein [Cyanobacteria bacterium SZAS LIN-3]|nr:tetratricopeptide repeat protein [Cyanobacteria bacterium SZAS LIN-3]MBS2006000.1 tetratricopeptide repeat protein [Cyanobacteria bacterium SZAS TMP-1]